MIKLRPARELAADEIKRLALICSILMALTQSFPASLRVTGW